MNKDSLIYVLLDEPPKDKMSGSFELDCGDTKDANSQGSVAESSLKNLASHNLV